jgi:uncharacterized membrane protein
VNQEKKTMVAWTSPMELATTHAPRVITALDIVVFLSIMEGMMQLIVADVLLQRTLVLATGCTRHLAVMLWGA